MKKLIKTLSLLGVVFAFFSCRGPQGVPGPAGQDGNANVQSATVETAFSNWEWSDQASNWAISFDWGDIDVNIVDYGALLVYVENPSSEVYAWHQLPLTMPITDSFSAVLETSYYDGGFSIFWTNTDLQKHADVLESFYSMEPMLFKVVLIDATSYAAHPDCDYSDFEEVKNTFNIK